MSRLLHRSLLLLSFPRSPRHFRSTPVTSLQLSQCTLALVPWSCSGSPRYPSCSLRGLASSSSSSSSSSPRAYYSARSIAPRPRLPLRLRRARRLRPPQLDVFICIEEALPDDPQIQVISYFLFVHLQFGKIYRNLM